VSEGADNPYPGLRPFEADQAHLFFGREEQCDDLLTRLARHRFVAVVGSSGSGKSSLVRAGLLPSLYGGFPVATGSTWKIALMRPGIAPIDNLASALNSPDALGLPRGPLPPAPLSADGEGGEPIKSEGLRPSGSPQSNRELEGGTPSNMGSPPSPVRGRGGQGGEGLQGAEFTVATLRRGPLGLIEAARLAGLGDPEARKGENLLVVVDQFEELFRFARPADSATRDERAAFVRLLIEAAGQQVEGLPSVPIYVMLTLRSDYIGDCSRYPELAAAISASQFLVPRLTRDQLKAAIEGPAAVGGASVTPRLLQRLLGDVGEDSDQLPLLQHALMRTWESWAAAGASGPLDLPHYEKTGGTAEALSQHADEAFAELDAEGQRVARLLFRTLTEKNDQQRGVRRPTELAQVAAVAAVTAAVVAQVVEVFRRPGRSFLMPPAGTPLEDSTVLDISHESLMRVWKRLRDWVDEEGAAAARYRRLAESARLYEAGEAKLLSEPELSAATAWWTTEKPTAAWAGRHGADFPATAGFFEKSRKRARVIARVQFLALPVVITLLLAYAGWRQKSRADAEITKARAEVADQQEVIARLEEQKSALAIRVAAAGDSQQQRLAEIAVLSREKNEVAAKVESQRSDNRQLQQRIDHLIAKKTELAAKAAGLRDRETSLAAAIRELLDRAPRIEIELREKKARRQCMQGLVEKLLPPGSEQLDGPGSPWSESANMSSGDPADLSRSAGEPSGGTPEDVLRREVAGLEALLSRLEAAAPAAQQELDSLRQAKALLDAVLAELKRQADELEKRRAALAAEVAVLVGETRRLEAKVAGLQQEKDRIVEAGAEQEKELRKLDRELRLLRRQLQMLDRNLDPAEVCR
jgi:energy-coupling factor transporter ATP-binding protein EcfA2/predicted  nucleic acid-binding Zn-ribbon protein